MRFPTHEDNVSPSPSGVKLYHSYSKKHYLNPKNDMRLVPITVCLWAIGGISQIPTHSCALTTAYVSIAWCISVVCCTQIMANPNLLTVQFWKENKERFSLWNVWLTLIAFTHMFLTRSHRKKWLNRRGKDKNRYYIYPDKHEKNDNKSNDRHIITSHDSPGTTSISQRIGIGMFLGIFSIFSLYIHSQNSISPTHFPSGKHTLWIASIDSHSFYTKKSGIQVLSAHGRLIQNKNNIMKLSQEQYSLIIEVSQAYPIPEKQSVIMLRSTSIFPLAGGLTWWVKPEGTFTILRSAPWYEHYAQKISDRLNTSLNKVSNNARAVIPALAVGDSRAIKPQLQRDFTESGIIHALVFSGAHFAIILSLLNLLIPTCVRIKWWWKIIQLFFIASVAFIAGLTPAIIRAAVMSAFLCITAGTVRMRAKFNILCFSIIALLLCNPQNSSNVGLALSVVAVLSIWIFSRPVEIILTAQLNIISHTILSFFRRLLPFLRGKTHWLDEMERNHTKSKTLAKKNSERDIKYSHRNSIQKNINKMIESSKKHCIQTAAIALVCIIGTSLITVFFHANLGLITLFANIVTEPLIFVLTMLGQGQIFLANFCPQLASYTAQPLGVLADILCTITHECRQLQDVSHYYGVINFPIPSILAIIWIVRRMRTHKKLYVRTP